MYVAVLVRRLRSGMTYDDFIDAWYPDKGFGFAGRGPFVAHNFSTDESVARGRP